MFNRNPRRGSGELGAKSVVSAIAFIWVAAALLSLTLTGVVIWGVIKLVNHFTG